MLRSGSRAKGRVPQAWLTRAADEVKVMRWHASAQCSLRHTRGIARNAARTVVYSFCAWYFGCV